MNAAVSAAAVAEFLVAAHRKTYADKNAAKAPSTRLQSFDYRFERDGLVYHDTYFGMRDYIGEEAVNTALRRVIDKHRAGVPPFPTALDAYDELQAVTPDSLKYLLTDLFATVTFWDAGSNWHWRKLYGPTPRGAAFAKIAPLIPPTARVASTDEILRLRIAAATSVRLSSSKSSLIGAAPAL